MFNYTSNYQVPTQTIQIIIYDRCSNLRDEKKMLDQKDKFLGHSGDEIQNNKKQRYQAFAEISHENTNH